MKVHELMTRDVVVAHRDTPVSEVAARMIERAISGVPVVEPDGRVVGLVTELDLVVRSTRLEPPAFLPFMDAKIPLETPGHYQRRLQHMIGTHASDAMSEDFETIAPDAEVEDLAELMTRRHVNPVPVVEGDRLVGIISRADILRMMVRGPADEPAAP